MDLLLSVWEEAWLSYEIDNSFVVIALVVIAAAAYRDWVKTVMVSWMLVYLWTMVTLLSSDIDLGAGMNVVWVCGYGLVGFLILALCYFKNLNQ